MKRVYVPDIECDSCVKVVSRRLEKLGGVTDFRIGFDHVDVEGPVTEKKLVETIKAAGFRASTNPFERKTFAERWRDWKENPEKYAIERRVLGYFLGALGILTLVAGAATRFMGTGWWLFYLILSVASIGAAIWHFATYRAKVTCMVGMMIGMTVGMQTGMMIGAVVGATNGFFTGAMVGMLLGVAVGALTGRCCGIMGIMEGMMAGVMGGTMGPMISVMMFADRLLVFMPFYMLINILILAGMVYMYFEESIEHQEVERREYDFVTFASLCVIATGIIGAIMLYGPKSALFA